VLETPSKKQFWFVPLGGSGEIGMNLNVFGHHGDFIIVDCGISFNDRLGVDIIMPDPTAIIEQMDNLKGIVLTHAHEDHIGAIPYLWPYLKCPIYATPFTAQVLRQKLEDKSWAKNVKIIEVPLSGTINVGNFEIEYITLTHSIPEPNALAIRTPLGCVLHTGDWKIDNDPLIGEKTDHNRLVEIGKEGVLSLICDSTNALDAGTAGSEADVRVEIEKLLAKITTGRVLVSCFSSNVARIETIALVAAKMGRKVALVGRSLERMVRAAQHAGYLKNIPGFVAADQAMSMPPEKILFISTGSQGEYRSALARIALEDHPIVSLSENDTVVFSSRMIPGNERAISFMQNRLIRKGIRLVTSYDADIHVSGHPARDDLTVMYNWVKPQSLIPVHGEGRHMQGQAELGVACGIKHTLVPYNGAVVELAGGKPKIINQVDSGRWGIDGKCLVNMDSPILKQRQKISVQGIVFVSVATDDIYQMLGVPIVTPYGITEPGEESDSLINDLRNSIKKIMRSNLDKEKLYKDGITREVRQVCNQRFGKKPLIEVHFTKLQH
jgi:ribonuclease J